MARARSSFPVPLSPWISTVTSVRAIRLTTAKISCMADVRPSMPSQRVAASRTLFLDVGLDRLEIRRPLERDFQVVEPDRLVVIVERAELDRADRAHAAAGTGEDDHLGLGRGLHDLIQRLQPRLRALPIGGQPEVEADERRLLALERREGLHAVQGKEEREVVAQPILELRTDQLLVLDDEEGGLVHAPPPIGSLTETTVTLR